jgi:uncharacterized protein (TIGR02246 family)
MRLIGRAVVLTFLMKEDIMRMLSGFLALVLLLGTVPVVWAQADPAKEIADIARKRAEAATRGDVDTWVADLADNVVFTVARAGFRIEGRDAVRRFITNLWQNYPTRQELTQQVIRRVFQDGNVFIINSYTDQIFIDKNGRMSTMMQRNSQTWVKTGGRWLLVDLHNSGMPGAPYTP